jgi:microcystin-dependent protein
MANYEATKYDFSGANLTGIQGVNTGIIVPWSDASIPTGFLECNGAAVSRTTYSDLFAVIGTDYGVGDGSSTFNLPDLTDRCCVSNSPAKSLTSSGGANTVTKTGNVTGGASQHAITVPELPSHTHSYNTGGGAGAGGSQFDRSETTSPGAGSGNQHSHNSSINFTGNATSVLQPYLTLVYIIKT